MPANGERRWGTNVTNLLIALGNNALSKAGGNFTLASADVNFGTNFGLVVKYIKSVSSNISTTGVFRLANNEGIGWRNFANAADILLLLNASNRLTLDGVNIPTISSTDTLTNKTLSSPVITTPSGLTKSDVGLGNVDNTSDANKPVSTAQAAATTAAILAERSAAVQLTNKDIDGGTASASNRFTIPKAALSILTALGRKQASVYYDTTSNKMVVDNGTSLVAVGSGSGGTKNYVTNPNDANAGWTPSSAGVTVTTESTTSFLPDNASQTTGIKIAYVSGTNPYAYTRWTMDAVDYTVLGQILMDATTAAAAGVFQVQLWTNTLANYSGTSTQVTLSSASVPTGTSKFIPVGAAGSSTAPYMELRIVATAAGTLYLNNVTYTPSVVQQSSITTEWASYTPSLGSGFGTATNLIAKWKRTNADMEIKGSFTLGTVAAALGSISLPTGYTIYSTALNLQNNASNPGDNVGWFQQQSAGAARTFALVTAPLSTTGFVYAAGNVAASNNLLPTNPGTTMDTGSVVSFYFRVPIAEWAGQVMAVGAGANVYYLYSSGNTWGTSNASATTAQGPGGILGGTSTPAGTGFAYTFVPVTPVPIGCKPEIEISSDGLNWAPPGTDGGASIIENLRFDGTNFIGAGVSLTSAGKIKLTFGKYACGTSTAWSGTWYWRITVANPSAPVGVLVAGTDGSAGYAQAGKLPGYTAGAGQTGCIGEVVASTSVTTSVSVSASNFVATNIRTLTLNKGIYLVTGAITPPGVTGTIGRLRGYSSLSSGTTYGFAGDLRIDVSALTAQLQNTGVVIVTADGATFTYTVDSLNGSLTGGPYTFTHSLTAVRIA